VTRLQGLVLAIFVVALSTSVIAGSPRYVFAVTALVIFGFVAVGFLVLPKLECALPFSAPPPGGEKVVIGGIETSGSDFGSQFTCTFQLAGWDKPGRWLLISAAAFYVLLARIPAIENMFTQYPMLSTYAGFMLGMSAVSVVISWYEEQQFFCRAAVTWGTAVDDRRYCFTRPETGYHGGAGKGLEYNPVFVLFDPSNPDRNVCVQSLKFRSLIISRTPRHVQKAAASN
jgi:hypothetical protein